MDDGRYLVGLFRVKQILINDILYHYIPYLGKYYFLYIENALLIFVQENNGI